ncbi:MAG: hypothetical protein IKQ31_03765 [Clostridia bacterium]|nr:hypothetical protein [Clostridia bacterium]
MQWDEEKAFSKLPWTDEFRSEFPTRQALSYLVDKDFEKLQDFLFAEKLVDFRKAQLISHVLKNEIGIVKNDNEVILTINLPIGEFKCVNCKRCFYRQDKQAETRAYLNALYKEIEQLRDIIKRNCYFVKALCYSGNLLALTESDIQELLSMCEFPLSEINVEVDNPLFITKEKLAILKKFGVERLICNIMSFNTVTLRKLCRHYEFKDIYPAFKWIAEFGFEVSFGLVIGFETEQELQIKRNINLAAELGASSIELYSRFCPYETEINSLTLPCDIALQRKNLTFAYDEMSRLGFIPYFLYCTEVESGCFENVGYALSNRKNKYLEDKRMGISTELACGCDVKTLVKKHFTNQQVEVTSDFDMMEYVKNIDSILNKKREKLLQYTV